MFLLCLIVRNDAAVAEGVCRELPLHGIRTHVVGSLRLALATLRQWRIDVILLEGDGFGERVPELLRGLACAHVPVVLMTGASDEGSVVRRLEDGATDVVCGQQSGRLAALRLRKLALLRRGQIDDVPAELRVGSLLLDTRRGVASVDALTLELSARQFDVLLLLALHAGEHVHRQSIADAMRCSGRGHRGVDMMVCRLRQKLREAGRAVSIHTVLGEGYCLRVIVEEPALGQPSLALCA